MDTETLSESLKIYMSENPRAILMIIWVLFWKGLALWQAAGRKQKIWFVAILVLNTMGILEIFYLIFTYWREKHRPINPLAPKHFSDPKNPNLP